MMENKKRLSELLTGVSEKQELSNKTLDKNVSLLTQISNSFFIIAKKMGAKSIALEKVESALVLQNQPAQQAEKIPSQTQPKQANKVESKKNQKQSEQKTSIKGGLAMTALGGALMFGADIIEGMVAFFKDPMGIITKLLSSLGEAITEFFEGDTFKQFIVGAFEEGKDELTKVFDNIKDIFSIIIGNPISNLLDSIKLSFIDITKSGLERLPDWLKGENVKDIQQKLDKVKEDIKAGKESRVAEEAATKKRIEVRNAKKEEPPQQAPEVQPPQAPQAQVPQTTKVQPTTTAAPLAGAPEQQVAPPVVSAEKKAPPSDAKPVKISAEQGKKAMIQAMDKYNVDDPTQRAAIMAQVGHESGNFTTLSENLNYRPTTLLSLFKKYFGTKDEAEEIASQGPVAIADRIYGGRMGNAPEGSGEGFKFRGRGFIQLTGKNNYQKFGVASNPDSVAEVGNAAETAMKYILNYKGDWSDIKGLTKYVNGGYIGLEDRQKHFEAYVNDPSITTAQAVQSPSTSGTQTAQLSASVNASKRQQPNQVVYNINNSSSTAVKVGAPQGSSTTIARDVATV